MKSRLLGAVCAFVITQISISVDAALVAKLDGLVVYDSDRNITWMADANYAVTTSYDSDGLVNFAGAQGFIRALNSGTVDNLGFNNWRLPTTVQPDPSCDIQTNYLGTQFGSGTNCTGGELGHLFYDELGGTPSESITNSLDPDVILFSNIQDGVYWSSTEWDRKDTVVNLIWVFDFEFGSQHAQDRNLIQSFVWAVHDGDVGAVPIPPALWLFGSGLIGLVGVARRKAA